MVDYSKYGLWSLRIGLAFCFFYVAVTGFMHPEGWVGFVPSWLPGNPMTMLYGHLVFDAVIGLWLIFGWKLFWGALLGTLNLAVIVLVNLGQFDLIFRDVGLFAAALALTFLSYKRK